MTEVVTGDLKRRVRDSLPGSDTSAFDAELDQVVERLVDASSAPEASQKEPGGTSDGAWKSWMTTLGVPLSADTDAVRRAHRILVSRYHPDNPRTGDREKFNQVRRAYAQALRDLEG